jgi:hypothetical protein
MNSAPKRLVSWVWAAGLVVGIGLGLWGCGKGGDAERGAD